MARTTHKREFEMTISPELFNAWGQLRRKKDAEVIAQEIGKSRPVIDRALNFGHVKDQRVIDGITDFFTKRKRREDKQANKLLSNDKPAPEPLNEEEKFFDPKTNLF